MKILYVQHDMLQWAAARQWSYTTHLSYVDGLRAQGHEVQVILTSCWLRAAEIVGDRKFDQVWINEVTHSVCMRWSATLPPPLKERDFAWLATLAPVRVGIVMETLRYDEAEYAELPELRIRVARMQAAVLPHVTHFCTVDENDVRTIAELGKEAIWTPCHVPVRFFRASRPQVDRPAIFIGTAYARRVKYGQHPRLESLLEFRPSREHQTQLPAMFDLLNWGLRNELLQGPFQAEATDEFVQTMHTVRASLFECYLNGLGDAMATVNLPSFVKTYAGRVIESMAVGQPVVSWHIPDRSQNARLFHENETILFFANDSPDSLADALERLRREPGLAERIGSQAQANALKHHTTEHRVKQILEWVDNGRRPVYWD
ncbi:glycosyltransferase family 1 protein [Sphaerotilus montanus]|uniref:Spore protein YkvP/CgeB glycosyl transferase-like domain-containing protein n=1 Tax=Sphaerotilus montanus TaxID=522889 RepID=A0A7Y9UK52_9BURK|nr:glycosyltransferase [Sphaerotilus montanus]NYG33375.1 hypothetical protein [Sphaerotilus montanus]NZD56991.1 glycosyltransferase family 1 protein [Sphaerotilus montanus]